MTSYINPELEPGIETMRHRNAVIGAGVEWLEQVVVRAHPIQEAPVAAVDGLHERRERVVTKIPAQRQQNSDVKQYRQNVEDAFGEAA